MPETRSTTAPILLCLLPIILATSPIQNTNETSTNKCKWCDARLPTNIEPYHYNLYIKADVKQLTFNGFQQMHIRVRGKTNIVIFHVKGFDIIRVSLHSIADGARHQVKRHFSYDVNEYHVVETKNLLPAGKYVLGVGFKGNVSRKLTGFYRSTYKESDEENVLLTTKFQPTDARGAFPCLDEPSMKASFNITIQHPKEYMARSNMPGTRHQSSSQWAITRFPKTVRMSTYLIAYVVSKFKRKYTGMAGNRNNVTVSIWSRPEYTEYTEFGYNESTLALTFLEKYLQYSYPMPKLDMFAIPDYASGATEHWGIITYRESRLLYQPGVSSLSSKLMTSTIIAHEVAHLWFGNLVTCRWWNDLWVQEGLASYLEYYVINPIHPEWNMWDRFFTMEILPGLQLDALSSTSTLSQRVEHPNQIKQLFGTLTYRKGASILAMLDTFLSAQLFRKGLNVYLTNNAYGAGAEDDLWNAFSTVSNQDIKPMMHTWTRQKGFPLVTVQRNNNGTFNWSQKRFFIDPSMRESSKTLWTIPFVYGNVGNSAKTETCLLQGISGKLPSQTSRCLLGNFGRKGFYRVSYDDACWRYIVDQLIMNPGLFSVPDRAGTLDDAFTLARSGIISYSVSFRLIGIMKEEESGVVWNVFLSSLSFLDVVLSSHRDYMIFKRKFASLLQKKVKRSPTSKFIGASCRVGEEYTIAKTRKQFKGWMVNGTQIPANVRKETCACAVANGDTEEWNFLFEKYMSNSKPSERHNYLFALSATRKPSILNRWLRYTVNASIVRPQDMVYVIRYISTYNDVGKYMAWDFAEKNWEKLMSIARENNFHVQVLTSGLTSKFNSPRQLQKVKALWNKFPDAGSGRKARYQGIEKMKTNIEWVKQNGEQISKLLRSESFEGRATKMKSSMTKD